MNLKFEIHHSRINHRYRIIIFDETVDGNEIVMRSDETYPSPGTAKLIVNALRGNRDIPACVVSVGGTYRESF